MHTLLDLRGNIPSFIHVSHGKLHDVNVLDLLIPQPAAVSVYLLVAIIRKRLKLQASLYTLLQIFSVTLFEKIPLNKAFRNTQYTPDNDVICNQLNLFNN